MLDLDKVTLRWGRDARFLNVDYDGVEVGHIRFDADGRVDRVWAEPWKTYGPVLHLLARCARSLGPA